MKNIVLLFTLLLLRTLLNSQTPVHIQVQVPFGVVTGSTPADPNFSAYTFQQQSNTLQGVVIYLPPTEVRVLTFQSNNCRFKLRNLPTALMPKVEVNFDDAGFQAVFTSGDGGVDAINQTGWLTPPQTFMTIGQHKLKVRYQLGDDLFTREYIAFVTQACQELHVDGTSSSITTGNTLTVWNNPDCVHADPVLLSEGFDPTDARFPEFYRFRGNALTQRMFELGYKVYILNYNLAGQDMRNNAAVYTAALRYISQINGGKKVVAVGMSMGGVITRYALAKGEADNLNLPVSMFISLDAPQQGAVMDRHFQDDIKVAIPNIPALQVPAARQLLINHAWENRESHLSFYNELRGLNTDGYPHRIPRIGASFSNDVPNPHTGSKWLEARIPFPVVSYTVKNEWAQAGSFLPTSTTNIEPHIPTGLYDIIFPVLLIQNSLSINLKQFPARPTFIPFNSALDITNGVSKFPIRISANAASPHDEVPTEISDGVRNAIANLSILTNVAANETYNFTSLQGNIIRQNINVFGNLVVNRSGASASSLNPQPASPTNLFSLTTRPCEPISITVANNGRLEIGDNTATTPLDATVTLKNGDILTLNNNATLRIRGNSQLVIGSGARLVLGTNSNIELANANSRIVIQNGGQLVLNGGTFQATGQGHLRLEQGHVTTFTGNLTLRGSNLTHRFLVLGSNAQLNVNDGDFTVENGIIQAEGSTLGGDNNFIRLAPAIQIVNMTDVTFNALQGIGGKTFVLFDQQPTLEATFTRCTFNVNGGAVKVAAPTPNVRWAWGDNNFTFNNCRFNNSGIYAERAFQLFLNNSYMDDCGIYAENTYWLRLENTVLNGPANVPNGPPLPPEERSGIGIEGTDLIHCHLLANSLITGYIVGVDDLKGLNGNIFMNGSTIQNCTGGIRLNGGFSPDAYGLVYMNGSRLIDNTVGIEGTDILFSIYARNKENVFSFPNNLMSPDRHFRSLFKQRMDTQLWFHGNTWNPNLPFFMTPINGAWEFRQQPIPQSTVPWAGTFFTNPISFAGSTALDLRDNNDNPMEKPIIVNVNGVNRDLRIQRNAAAAKLKIKKLKDALDLFEPIALINDNIRETASDPAKHVIDMARAFTFKKGTLSTRSSNNGWLPETLVKPNINTEGVQLAIFPSPTSEQFQIALDNGSYTMTVFDALGRQVATQDIQGTTLVDSKNWQNGIYLVKVLDKTTKETKQNKVVIQH